ncbi:type II secretion system protein GspD [Botrimarina colliarenosi]|uniref:type II secretion system protein GspD n=1 Tax=Botrimarina colliarenosi TaxID=2528001 RepID=UPI0018D46756|nr:type II secretion system protein GspD [Botrimarina colliarenosi]
MKRTQRTAIAARMAGVVGCAVIILASALASHAQGPPPAGSGASRSAASAKVVESLRRRGDLTLRDATLETALFTISELWGVNIVAAKVEGSVNGVFKDAPLRDILDTILLSNGYAYRPVGGSLIVSRLQDLGQINPFFVSETIPVGMTDINELVEAARLMSTPQGQVQALPTAGALLVVDFADRVEMIRELVQQLDAASRGVGVAGGGPKQLEVAYFRTHYISAVQASTAIDVILSADGRTSAVEGDDRLLVVDYSDNIRMVESVLSKLDRPRPQVNIKALIYDISLSDMEKIGINWNGISNGSIDAAGVATGKSSGLRFLTQTAAPLTATGSGGAFNFYSIEGDLNLSALVVALQEAEDSRLLADPNVTVMDNEAANIESISEIPFQQLTQTTGGGNIGTTAFKEVGIKLDVTPKISRDTTIDLTVAPEFSRLAGYTPGDNQPIVETRRATTRVRVLNGQTIMIAGLRQRTDVGNFNGVPLLKDVRYIGRLFRSRETRIVESELVVFITPEIVGYSDGLDERDRLTSDTVNCRLERIPPAEGCPTCGQNNGCDCLPVDVEGPAFQMAPEIAPPSLEGRQPPYETAPSDVLEPIPSPEPLDSASSDITPLPSQTRRDVYRLPPASGVNQAALAGNATGQVDKTEPMRMDYDSRFRATGSVYPDRQRLTSSPSPEPAAERQEAKKSFWQFWR